MKKLFTYFTAVLFVVCLVIAPPVMAHGNGQGQNHGQGHGYDDGPGMGPGNGNGYGHNKDNGQCCNPCPIDTFNADAFQSTGVFDYSGLVFEDDGEFTVKNGALASGQEEASASVNGVVLCDGWGIGGAAALGGSIIHIDHAFMSYDNTAAGLVGNISAAGYGGENAFGVSKVEGSGELTTAAVSNEFCGPAYAGAMSFGSFGYTACTTSQGVVIGGGLTAGVSHTNIVGGTVSAISGQVSVAGAGTINMGGPR